MEHCYRIFHLHTELLKNESRIDINSNEGVLPRRNRSRTRSGDSLSEDIPNNSQSVKRERNLGSSGEEDRDDEIYNDEELRIRRNSVRQSSKDDDENDRDSDDDRGRRSSGSSQRRSSSDPMNLSVVKSNNEDSDDGNIDVETIGNAPPKVSECQESKPKIFCP